MVMRLDAGSYGLEWMGSTGETESAVPEKDSLLKQLDQSVSLKPPVRTERQFAPIPGPIGRKEFLSDGVEFLEIETTGGWVESDETFVTFEPDGTASFTAIVLENSDGQQLILEILPLADTVRIYDEAL